MELPVLIKNCVDSYGQSIIMSKRLIGILDDKHAFDEIGTGPYKKILRSLINDDYVRLFYDLGKYNQSEIVRLASNYAQTNLLQEDHVLYLFDCLAFGVGWLNQAPVIGGRKKTPQPTGQQGKPLPKPPKGGTVKNNCPNCGTQYYKPYSKFCHICGSQR